MTRNVMNSKREVIKYDDKLMVNLSISLMYVTCNVNTK